MGYRAPSPSMGTKGTGLWLHIPEQESIHWIENSTGTDRILTHWRRLDRMGQNLHGCPLNWALGDSSADLIHEENNYLNCIINLNI